MPSLKVWLLIAGFALGIYAFTFGGASWAGFYTAIFAVGGFSLIAVLVLGLFARTGKPFMGMKRRK